MTIPTRRLFLGATAAALLGTRGFAAAQASGEITLGFSTYGTKSLKTEDAIDALAKIGFDSIELAALAGWDADPMALTRERRAAVRKRLSDSGLRLTSLMENVPPTADEKKHQQGLNRLKAASGLAHDLSPDRPPVIETVLGGKEWEKSKPLFVRRLTDWAKLARDESIVIAIKPHRGTGLDRPEQAVELFKALGEPAGIRLDYDYSHFALRDMPMDQTIRVSLPWTVFVSVKDVAIENGKEVFKLPGETGQIDYAAMLRELYAGGYRGDVNCEVSSQISNKPGYDGLTAAKTCYANMASAFKAAEVPRSRRQS